MCVCLCVLFPSKRYKQTITLDTKDPVKAHGVAMQIYRPSITISETIATKALDEIEGIFKYELCSYPPALVDSSIAFDSGATEASAS